MVNWDEAPHGARQTEDDRENEEWLKSRRMSRDEELNEVLADIVKNTQNAVKNIQNDRGWQQWCPAEIPDTDGLGTYLKCVRPVGHNGLHEDPYHPVRWVRS